MCGTHQNLFCAVSYVKVYGPLFAEPTVTGISHQDIFENYLMPQLEKDMDRDFIFQQDGAPQHFNCEFTSYINRTVAAWIGRGGTIAWPPRSSDLTPLDFLCGGTLKTKFLFYLFLKVRNNYGHG
jgi:hypothetical protein